MFNDDTDRIDKIVLDTHKLHLWKTGFNVKSNLDIWRREFLELKKSKFGLWVGEFNFATDTCQTWIDGFQHNAIPPIRECAIVDCPIGDPETMNFFLNPPLDR